VIPLVGLDLVLAHPLFATWQKCKQACCTSLTIKENNMTTVTHETNPESNTSNGGNQPDWRLVQQKIYLAPEEGVLTRKKKTVPITVGWNQESKEGMHYISLADSVMTIEPDVDGRINLVLFPSHKDEQILP